MRSYIRALDCALAKKYVCGYTERAVIRMTSSPVTVIKLDGTPEAFNSEKLRSSLRRSGAESEITEAIVRQIEAEITEGITTAEIYRRAFSLLRKQERPTAARYSMKRAIRELGPSGFPFEDFVGEIFKARGYAVSTGSMVKGRCALHELDMRAEKDGSVIGAELKFHNNLGIKSDLKIALYVHARFEDLKTAKDQNGITEGWLITNTSFTQNAIDYAACVGLTMISWNYPAGNTLQDLIEEAKVQPVTALTSLTQREKRLLLEQEIVLCRSLPEQTKAMEAMGMPNSRIGLVLKESKAVCGV